ncbi:MAG: SagB/ThcOx family dehydrogenase [Acidobacteriota bacterium]
MRKDEWTALTDLVDHRQVSSLVTESSLSELFHENTKLHAANTRSYGERIAAITRNPEMVQTISQPYKVYSLSRPCELAPVAAESGLEQAIEARRSVRTYRSEAISRDDLGRLLHFAYGRTDKPGYFRAVASGGALFPLEIYTIVLSGADLEAGIYHYGPEDHRLHLLRSGDFRSQVEEYVLLEGVTTDTASALIVISGFFSRSTFKYQDRGYRMILMEAGAVAQNLGLVATEMGWGGCLMGGFLDDQLNALLGLDGLTEAALLPMILGRPTP